MIFWTARISGIALFGFIAIGCSSTENTGGTTGNPAPFAGIYNSTVVEGADDLEFVVSLAVAGDATGICRWHAHRW